jgi:hypothetical protein
MSDHVKSASPAENEKFVLLLRIAQEGGELGQSVRRIVSLEPGERKGVINEITAKMRSRNEPSDLVEAVEYLFNDEIAGRVRETLA